MNRYRIRSIITIACAFLAAFFATVDVAHATLYLTGGTPPQVGSAPGGTFTALSSGIFTYSKTDLSLGGSMPIEVTRVYRSQDKDSNNQFIHRDFGLGTTLSYDIYLYSNSETTNGTYTDAELIMPDGGRLNCTNSGSTSNYTQVNFVCNSQPVGVWFGSTITYNANTPGFDLKRKDGMVYSFGLSAPLQSMHDHYGNRITIMRSGGQTGTITEILSSDGRSVIFGYDSNNDITGATDGSRTVSYTYNTNHALSTVNQANLDTNATTTYQYAQTANAQIGDITTIILNVQNLSGGGVSKNYTYATYDSNHRVNGVSSSIQSLGYIYGYTMDPSNTWIQYCTVTLPDRSQRQFTFDQNGYVIAGTRGYGSTNPAPETTNYTRSTNDLITLVTDPLGHQTAFSYDSLANVLSITHTPGPDSVPSATTSFTYESVFNRVASIRSITRRSWRTTTRPILSP